MEIEHPGLAQRLSLGYATKPAEQWARGLTDMAVAFNDMCS